MTSQRTFERMKVIFADRAALFGSLAVSAINYERVAGPQVFEILAFASLAGHYGLMALHCQDMIDAPRRVAAAACLSTMRPAGKVPS